MFGKVSRTGDQDYFFIRGEDGKSYYSRLKWVNLYFRKKIARGVEVEFRTRVIGVKLQAFEVGPMAVEQKPRRQPRKKIRLTRDEVRRAFKLILSQPFPELKHGNVCIVDADGEHQMNIGDIRGRESYRCAISHAHGTSGYYFFIDPEVTEGRLVIISKEVAEILNVPVLPVSRLQFFNSRKLRVFYPKKNQAVA